MKKSILLFTLILTLWGTLHAIIITIDGLNDDLAKVDVGVVLGNKVELTGEPSKRLQSRLDKGVELYKKGYLRYIIVSGGIGVEGFDEAVVMKEYMVEKGVPEEVIIVDIDGYNTMMTAVNSKKIMDEKELDSVMVISQYYHIARSRLAFKKAGFDKVYSAHGRFFEIRDFYSTAREVVGYYRYLLYNIK
ncbi:YdcF family protein [Alkaliphilus hydrothermalis]|uniref:Vancomycin permeability regulator SanA n=1 Tax=Alkaliphilus hydrothermalis TaxID=1482730 RepID=A0ABS2NKP4_9FIRM|nr:YdcF family protein [Alkaliphilus hydrothermalis]MBM7613507.1 vancomycin permeability regulator SanA [Alkaliphilus hydrothermalis]